MEPAKGGNAEELKADIVLLSIGRRPYTDGVGLADAGVALDERGRVKTDAHYATNVPGIYAIGDVIAGPMLAHKAEEEGVALAERLAGQAGHVNYGAIPGVVYTWPEVAVGRPDRGGAESRRCGLQRREIPVHRECPRARDGRHRRVREDPRRQDDRPVLGAHIIGPDAGTLIAELATAMEFGASAEDVGAHLPRASDAERGGEGGGPGGGRPGAAYLADMNLDANVNRLMVPQHLIRQGGAARWHWHTTSSCSHCECERAETTAIA